MVYCMHLCTYTFPLWIWFSQTRYLHGIMAIQHPYPNWPDYIFQPILLIFCSFGDCLCKEQASCSECIGILLDFRHSVNIPICLSHADMVAPPTGIASSRSGFWNIVYMVSIVVNDIFNFSKINNHDNKYAVFAFFYNSYHCVLRFASMLLGQWKRVHIGLCHKEDMKKLWLCSKGLQNSTDNPLRAWALI